MPRYFLVPPNSPVLDNDERDSVKTDTTPYHLHFDFKKSLIKSVSELLRKMAKITIFGPCGLSSDLAFNTGSLHFIEVPLFGNTVLTEFDVLINALEQGDLTPLQEVLIKIQEGYELCTTEENMAAYLFLAEHRGKEMYPDEPMDQAEVTRYLLNHRVNTFKELAFYLQFITSMTNTLAAEILKDQVRASSAHEDEVALVHFRI